MSTIITHRQFPGYHKYEMELAGRPLTLEVGKLAELANAAVMVGYGDTRVLVCATASARPRDGIDFFPLSVDFEEKMYAVGRIPGSFNRREGRPGDTKYVTGRYLANRPTNDGSPYLVGKTSYKSSRPIAPYAAKNSPPNLASPIPSLGRVSFRIDGSIPTSTRSAPIS